MIQAINSARLFTLCAVILSASLTPSAGAFPLTQASMIRHSSAMGLFPKVRFPRVNVGKGAKALLYPVTKAAVNSGKTAIKGAKTGVEVYSAWHGFSSKYPGIPSPPRIK